MMLPASARLRQLSSIANDFKVDKNVPIRRYYRSGSEMLKMGNVYLAEDNHEKAYILYLKYLTLFLEKVRRIRKNYENVPKCNFRV